ncbi:MAG: LamG domain-containing protein, partial [Candidatus Poribacteria bacterium]
SEQDRLFESLDPPQVSFSGRAMDRSGAGRDAIVTGNVVLLPEDRSRVARFGRTGQLQLHDATWWNDTAPKSAMSLLAWVRMHEFVFFGAPEAARELLEDDFAVDPPFEAPISLFPYVTKDGFLHWSLHSPEGSPLFTLDADVDIGKWLHVAATYDSVEGRARLYIDGEEVAMGHSDGELGVYAGPTGIVTINPAAAITSWSMDDLNIWGRALSGDEVRSVMLSGPTLDNVTAVDEGDTVTTWAAIKGR